MPDELPVWVHPGAGGVALQLHVQPGAKRTEIVGVHGDALKIRLAAPPVDGRANAALLDYLARRLGVAGQNLRLTSGESSRRKRIVVAGIAVVDIVGKLAGPGC